MKASDMSPGGWRRLVAGGLVMEGGCLMLARLPGGEGASLVFPFLGAMGVMGLAYLTAGSAVVRGRGLPAGDARLQVTAILCLSGLFCLTLLPGGPLLDNDLWRYLWDGKVLASGINPYLHAPADPALASLREGWHGLIGYPQLPTPYPPAAEVISLAMHLLGAGGLWLAKAVPAAFFLASCLVLLKLLDAAGADRRLVLLWAWNPTALKEFADSAHLDAAAVFFLLAGVWLALSGRERASAVSLALGVGVKLFPLFAAPWLFWRSRRRGWWALVFAGTLLALYLPFWWGAGWKVSGSLGTYLGWWLFNHGPFELLSGALGLALPMEGDLAARYLYWLGAASASVLLGRRAARSGPAGFCRALGMFLFFLVVLSPAVMPWYVAWSVPLLAVVPVYPALAFSVLSNAAYVFYLARRDVPGVRWAEYALLLLLLVFLGPRKEGGEGGPTPAPAG